MTMKQRLNNEKSSTYKNAGEGNTRTILDRTDQCIVYCVEINPSDMFTREEKVLNTFRKEETRL